MILGSCSESPERQDVAFATSKTKFKSGTIERLHPGSLPSSGISALAVNDFNSVEISCALMKYTESKVLHQARRAEARNSATTRPDQNIEIKALRIASEILHASP